jgi:hypothetical protein
LKLRVDCFPPAPPERRLDLRVAGMECCLSQMPGSESGVTSGSSDRVGESGLRKEDRLFCAAQLSGV